MGTRVSQYVHFIIYQTASKTRGGGCDRLGQKEERDALKEMERLRDGEKQKG